MSKKMMKTIGGAALAIFAVIVLAQVWVPAQVGTQNDKGLAGSWDVQVTIRDCANGAALTAFPAMMTYQQGGTMTEAANDAAPLLRTGGQGVWNFQSDRRYSASFQFFRYNSDGSYAGKAKIRKRLDVNKSGNAYSATATFEFFDPAGNSFVTGCATEAGTRFE